MYLTEIDQNLNKICFQFQANVLSHFKKYMYCLCLGSHLPVCVVVYLYQVLIRH